MIQSTLWIYFDDEPSNLGATEYAQDNDETEIIHNLHHAQTQHEAEATTIENRISALNNNLKQKEFDYKNYWECYRRKGQKDPRSVREKHEGIIRRGESTYQRETVNSGLRGGKTKGLEVKKMNMYKTKLRALENS